MTDFFIPRQEYRDVRFYVAFDEYDYIYYVDACPRCNFSISEYLGFTRWNKQMEYVGAIDFRDGNFELKAIEAKNIQMANKKLYQYIDDNYSHCLWDIVHTSIYSTSFIAHKLAEMCKN